jgi:hypothetical protein
MEKGPIHSHNFVISTGAYPNSCYAAPHRSTYAAFIKESRMKFAGATSLDRNSGERSGEICGLPFLTHALRPLRGPIQLDFLSESHLAPGGLLRHKSIRRDPHGNHNGTYLILQGEKTQGLNRVPKNSVPRRKEAWQGLKPDLFSIVYGPTKVVP